MDTTNSKPKKKYTSHKHIHTQQIEQVIFDSMLYGNGYKRSKMRLYLLCLLFCQSKVVKKNVHNE